ncbi:beta-galactosidase [Anaerolineales bacterium HSG25]|nr:beta-galactosidase [Anaerolineales bacterium HSG25]
MLFLPANRRLLPEFRFFQKIGTLKFLATLLLLILLLSLSADPPRELDLGPQQSVKTINQKIGIHTRLTDEVEPWKIQRTLQMVREMGSPWIVEYFPWAYREPSEGYFDWSHSDLVIEHANQQGLTVIGRLGFVPEWARPDESASSYLAPERYDDFGRYVHAFVERYGEQVPIIIIWNEPNLALEWGFQLVDPEEYTELLRVAYQHAKLANEDVIVLGGALAPTLAPVGDAQAMNDLIYLDRMLKVGAGGAMDGLSVHAYGWVFPADDPPDPQVVNFRRIELTRQLLVEHGYADLPIYVTEGGWNDHPRWTKAVRPGQRIENTIRAYQLAEEWPWLEVMGLWAFRYPWSSKTYLDYFTFVTPDFEPKPIYLEVQEHATNRGKSSVKPP